MGELQSRVKKGRGMTHSRFQGDSHSGTPHILLYVKFTRITAEFQR